jgi:hypothetical protein
VIASWHWSFEPKEIVSPQPTPPKLMVSPLATSLEKTIVSPVATLLLEKVMVVPLATLACCEMVTVVPLTLVTVVLAATPLPVTVMPVVGVPVKELKVSFVLLLVAPLVVPVTEWPMEFDIVTVLPLIDTMVVPLGIAELLVVSVTPIPVVMFVGNDARVKVVLGARVGALVRADATLVPTTAFERITVVEVLDTTVVHEAIAEEFVLSLTAIPVATADGTEAKFKVVLLGAVAALVVAVAAAVTAVESVTVLPLVERTWVPDGIAEEVVLSATELPGITSAGTVAAMVRVLPPARVAWLAVLDQRFPALPAPPSLRKTITFWHVCVVPQTPVLSVATSAFCAAVITPA